jgi:hypothetical protein
MSRNPVVANLLVSVLCSMLIIACSAQSSTPAKAPDTAATTGPYGKAEDIAFAGTLWQALSTQALTGPRAIRTYPYSGLSPHAEVLQYIDTTLTVNGQTGAVIVLHNYRGGGFNSDLDIDNVAKNPNRYLQSVAVMYKRPGYDPANKNWFWVRYLPDGSLDKDEQGIALAGRIAKPESSNNCIGCHAVAPADDRVFGTNRIR